MGLSAAEKLRYARQITLSEIGESGQAKLKQSSVLIVGAGGLGSPLALYLTAAGVGRVGLVDFDVVDESNLHRQVLHTQLNLGMHKLDSACATLEALNPHVHVETHPLRLDRSNALEIIRAYDIVADGTDNFATRYLVNDACVFSNVANVYGSVFQFEGQVSVFAHGDGPCYRCLYPKPPPPGLVPSCAEGGVLGVLPGLIGTLQANEVIKLLLGIGHPLIGRMLLLNALGGRWQTLSVRRDPKCEVCGPEATITELADYDAFCGFAPTITVEEFGTLRAQEEAFFLLDVRQPQESVQTNMRADQLIPVEELQSRMHELQAGAEDRIVVHCQTGARSMRAVQALRTAGYSRAVSLEGGIEAWMHRTSKLA